MISPSAPHITPEPAPRCPSPESTCTVERRSRSAPSPKACMLTSPRPYAKSNWNLLRFAAADEPGHDLLAHSGRFHRFLYLVGIGDRLSGQRDENISYQHTGLRRRSVGFQREYD